MLERVVDDEPTTQKSPALEDYEADLSPGGDDSKLGALRDQLREARSLVIQLGHELESANVALAEARAEVWRAQTLFTASRGASRIQEALAKALKQNNDVHSAEIGALQAQSVALQEKKRALSMAQQTRAGHIYVILNIGSFGHETFKVGMTRRLDPQDRVDELGDASVPFPFDVHMMLSCPDAPKLENTLPPHQQGEQGQLRKEFFRTSLQEIMAIVESRGESRGHRFLQPVEAHLPRAIRWRRARPKS